jgi:hypothetical protein
MPWKRSAYKILVGNPGDPPTQKTIMKLYRAVRSTFSHMSAGGHRARSYAMTQWPGHGRNGADAPSCVSVRLMWGSVQSRVVTSAFILWDGFRWTDNRILLRPRVHQTKYELKTWTIQPFPGLYKSKSRSSSETRRPVTTTVVLVWNMIGSLTTNTLMCYISEVA